MTDSEIVDALCDRIINYIAAELPVSPSVLKKWQSLINTARGERRKIGPNLTPIGAGTYAAKGLSPYQTFTLTGKPVGPPDGTTYMFGSQHDKLQEFWRCEHYPEAIQNWYAGRKQCEFSCNLSELRWHDNGVHRDSSAS